MNISTHDSIYYLSHQYDFSIGKINSVWNWQISHQRNQESKNLLTDILNPGSLNGQYKFPYTSNIQGTYRDFTPRGWRQITDISLTFEKKWQPNTQAFSGINANAAVFMLTQRFQQVRIAAGSDLYRNLFTYSFQNNILNRILSPVARLAVSFQSDNRKSFYYQIETGLEGNIAGEMTTWKNNLQLTWAIFPSLRLKTYNDWAISQREVTPADRVVPFAGYHLQQYTLINSNASIELNWFCTSALNLYGRIGYFTRNYRKEHVVQITGTGELIPFDYAPEPFSDILSRRLDLGLQWFFASISQLRLQYSYFPESYPLQNGNKYIYIYSNFASSTQFSLSFIYFLDGNKRK